MKDALPLIPRPAGERWRDIRLKHVPILVYLAGIGMVIFLWNTQWMPSSFTGEVQARVATVSSSLDGLLVDLPIQQFDRVTNGQALGKVVMPPEVASAKMVAIRADLLVLRARMSVDGERNQMDYQKLRVDQLDQKVDLAIARTKLRFAENELTREQKLQSEKIASVSDYESALNQRDALATEVKEREQLVAQMDQALLPLKPADHANGSSTILDNIDAAINAQEEKFRQSSEIILRSPIDGVVTKVSRNQNENVSSGELLITISSDRSENIVGFVRQPISFEPKAGDTVIVRTRRGNNRLAAEARIIKVGPRLEFFTQPLRVRGFDSSQERGLPVMVNLPDGMTFLPGELVDLALKK